MDVHHHNRGERPGDLVPGDSGPERKQLWHPEPFAVVFTHMAKLDVEDVVQGYVDRMYTKFFLTYFSCATRVKTVYCYVDWGIRHYLVELTDNNTLYINPDLLTADNRRIGALKNTERRVREEKGFVGVWPRFEYVGLQELNHLFDKLFKLDKDLPQYLFGTATKKFTYDAPKFVESVIRLKRMERPHLAWDPIVRVDEDVLPGTEFFDELLRAYQRIERWSDFYFFSGAYGGEVPDPVNDHAARTHFFLDLSWKPGEPIPKEPKGKIDMYLSDLSVLGAPQYSSADLQFTSAMDGILAERRSTAVPEKKSPCHLRDGPQCISGAGLIMSRNAVELLPPFTSFDENDLWVDDHIKRRLHEVLHHLDPQDDEVVGTAKAVQDRHPRGLNPGDFDWARDHYFDRLLRGCCLMSIISHPVEELTPYCSLLGEIVSFKVKVGDSRLSRSSQEKMFSWMTDAATQRYQEALRCWKDNKLAGTVLGDWASSLQESHRDKIIKQVRDDAWKYISLTLNWPAITRAVLQLTAQTNYWLYSEP